MEVHGRYKAKYVLYLRWMRRDGLGASELVVGSSQRAQHSFQLVRELRRLLKRLCTYTYSYNTSYMKLTLMFVI